MKICIIGLGLIGGSLAKAIKKNTQHSCYGIDVNHETIVSALAQDAIDGELSVQELSKCDVVILGLYPQTTVDFVRANADMFSQGQIVIDTCGIKSEVCTACEEALLPKGVRFLGCHPMAGRELWGFDASVDNLFDNASFIICPTENTPPELVEQVERLALEIGFLRCVTSSPKEHDRVIAFTSQLAHIVSSAYVKSPSLLKQSGFSAGSFKDLTRVARLNEDMWTSLFLLNREPLVEEISDIIKHLEEYKSALENGNSATLHKLLKEGRILKEKSNEQNASHK